MQARMATMLEVICCWQQTRILGNAVPNIPGYTLSRCLFTLLTHTGMSGAMPLGAGH